MPFRVIRFRFVEKEKKKRILQKVLRLERFWIVVSFCVRPTLLWKLPALDIDDVFVFAFDTIVGAVKLHLKKKSSSSPWWMQCLDVCMY